jgi:hypothetical protein
MKNMVIVSKERLNTGQGAHPVSDAYPTTIP